MTHIGSDFDRHLIASLPRLRRQALGLTRNGSAADDLVQETVANALGARHSFTPGTNFGAWTGRILRNRFISDIRRRRPAIDIDAAPEAALATPAAQLDGFALAELQVALARLCPEQREALFMIVLQALSYRQIAARTGCAVGTAKSRVFRARRTLAAWLDAGAPPAALAPARLPRPRTSPC
jgi:RNA polymerase sigma-70 factor (ECF subfamily)